jgi:hypothetical protein
MLARPSLASDHMPGVVFGGDITLSGARESIAAMAGSIAVSDLRASRLAAAAGSVQIIDGDIGRLAVAGGSVAVDGGQLGNVAIAGGDVKINTGIDGDLKAIGGTIVLTNAVRVGGDVDLSGGDVTVDGIVAGDMVVRADHAALAGIIKGTVRVTAGEITVAPGTRVDGDLVFAGPSDIEVPDDISVGGKIIRKDFVPWESTGDNIAAAARTFFDAAGVIFLGGLIICGLLLWLAVPRIMEPAAETLTRTFPASTLAGFVAVCAFPVVVLILMITVIGIPLAFVTVAGGAALTGLGILVFSYWAGNTIRARAHRPEPGTREARLGWTAGGLFAFLLVGFIPLVGNIAQVIATIAGIGAVLMNAWKQREAAVVP